MLAEQNFRDYMSSWDAGSIEVFRKMDAFDAVESMSEEDRNRVVNIGMRVFSNLESIADNILNAPIEKRDGHIEVLLLILAFAPTVDAMGYLRSMMESRPDIYNVLFAAVMQQQPLRDSGKIIRQRILFSMRRSRIIDYIYDPDVSLAVRSALESFKSR